MIDVTALGEALIDMTTIKQEDGTEAFMPNVGGAPLNVLAMLSKLNKKTAFIGKVGLDTFGAQIKQTAEAAGIDTTGLVQSPDFNTTLAFVHPNDAGDRSFTFYRKGCADVNLREAEINLRLIDECRIFHFGSLSLTDEPARSATIAAVEYAKAQGKLISYDPNYRPLLWSSENNAKEQMLSLIQFVDLIKVSEEELALMTGESDIELGAERLLSLGPALVLVTMGEKGSFFKNSAGSGFVPTTSIIPIDTTGCGDAFLGAFLSKLLSDGVNKSDLKTLTSKDLKPMLAYANSAGTLTALKKGAIPALPEKQDILKLVVSMSYDS